MEKNIDEILAKYFSNNASAEEKAFIETWKDENIENSSLFNSYKIIWLQSENETSFSPDANIALSKVSNKLTRKPVVQTKEINLRKIFTYAASLLILLLSSIFVWIYFTPEPLIVAQTHSQKIDILLPDGTKVWLNNNTSLKYPNKFDSDNRTVYFEGEAYFDVTPNPDAPFKIISTHSEVTVVGTEFNLVSKNNNQLLLVTEGRVNYTNNKQSMLVKAGESARIEHEDILQLPSFDTNQMAWKTGVLTYKDTPLQSLFRDISKLYDVKTEISDTSILTIKINANFDNSSVEDIIDYLDITIPTIDFTIDRNTKTINVKAQ